MLFVVLVQFQGLAVVPSAPIVLEVFIPRCPFCETSRSPRCWRQQLGDLGTQFLPLFYLKDSAYVFEGLQSLGPFVAASFVVSPP